MESLYLNRSMPSCFHANEIPTKTPQIPLHTQRLEARTRSHRFTTHSSKKHDFQDFQGYAKPTSLLPATEVKLYKDASPEKVITCIDEIDSRSLYKVVLRTSPAYGSGLSNLNAGILLCIIDDSGRSVLLRMPASSYQENIAPSDDFAVSDLFHFQRGSVDEFVFRGHKLGNVEAVWIGLESGGWKLDGANLTIINGSGESSGSKNECTKIRYDFEAEDIMLGEGSEISMVELRPCQSTEYTRADLFSLLTDNVVRSASLGDVGITNEESMRQYGDLKFSLLLYDAVLIFVGTSIASFMASESTALAFLTGGIGGFLYLLLLQRSVDQLAAPESLSLKIDGNANGLFRGVKGPILVLAFASGFFVLVAKRGSVEVESLLSPKELMAGMIGFLACKIAVVLAAFKPMRLKDSN